MGIWTKEGSFNLARIYFNSQSQNPKTYLGLFTNDLDPSLLNSAILNDLLEPSAGAYARIELASPNWVVTDELSIYPTVDFQIALEPFGTIYGCFIATTVNNSGKLLAIHKYTTPISLQYYGDILEINIRITIT